MLYKENWDQTKEVFEDWWERSLDRPILSITAPKIGQSSSGIDSYAFLRYYPDVEEAINRLLSQFAKNIFMKEAYPNAWINLGPGILSACLGADIKFDPDANTAWFEGKMSLFDIQELNLNSENLWWKYLVKCADLSSKKFYQKAVVALTDILDPITIVGQLRGNFPTNILRDMFLNGEKLKEVINKMRELWLKFYEEFAKLINTSENGYSTWAGLWSKKKHAVIQCDTIVYLSPKLFDQFVFQEVIEECRYFDRTIWHLDGPLELKHLDKLLSIPELDGIQWIPGAGSPNSGDDTWLPLYKKIQNSGKLLQIYDVPPQKVMHLLSKISPKNVAIQVNCESYRQARNLLEKFEAAYD